MSYFSRKCWDFLCFFWGFFLYLIMGELVTTEIRFFALKSKKEKGTG